MELVITKLVLVKNLRCQGPKNTDINWEFKGIFRQNRPRNFYTKIWPSLQYFGLTTLRGKNPPGR
jgi:hypothetical protein